MKARTGGETGLHLLPRPVQKIAEGKTYYELSLKVEVMIMKKYMKKRDQDLDHEGGSDDLSYE